jgi:zinc transporter ZupT
MIIKHENNITKHLSIESTKEFIDITSSFVNNKWLTTLVPTGSFAIYAAYAYLKPKQTEAVKESVQTLTTFYAGTLAASTLFETVVYYFKLREDPERPYMSFIVNAIHTAIPFSISYIVDKLYPRSPGKQQEKRILSWRQLTKSTYLWSGVIGLGALQLSTRFILPYLVQHESYYQQYSIPRRLIGVYKVTQEKFHGEIFGYSLQSVSNNIMKSLAMELFWNASFIVIGNAEDRVWKEFVKERLFDTNAGRVQSALVSGFMWSTWRSSIFIQGRTIASSEDMWKSFITMAVSGPLLSYVEDYTNQNIWIWAASLIARRLVYSKLSVWQTRTNTAV